MKKEIISIRKAFIVCIAVLLSVTVVAQSVTEITQEKESLKVYAGEYKHDNTSEFAFDVTITFDKENGLQAQPTDQSQPKVSMIALEKDQFELLKTGGLIATFNRNEKGEVISITMSNGEKSFTCKRK